MTKHLIMFFVLTASANASATALPDQAIGVWQLVANPASCTAEHFGARDSVIRIHRTHIEFWETNCNVTRIDGMTQSTLEVSLQCTGEGSSRIQNQLWQFSEIAGQSIATVADLDNRSITTYKKCKK